MKMVFHFPTSHDSCISFTIRIHKEYELGFGNRKRHLQEILPFRFGLACFSITPYSHVVGMRLELVDKQSMMVVIQWD